MPVKKLRVKLEKPSNSICYDQSSRPADKRPTHHQVYHSSLSQLLEPSANKSLMTPHVTNSLTNHNREPALKVNRKTMFLVYIKKIVW